MRAFFDVVRVACGLIRKPLPIVQTSKCKWNQDGFLTDNPLYSLANNKPFYEYMNSCHADDIYEYTSSLDNIIREHEELSIKNKNIKIFEQIGEGGFNRVYRTDDPNKVFRMLYNYENEEEAGYLNKGTSKPKLLIDGEIIRINLNSMRELYGLIIQYYFTQKCVDHVCKVYDFGIMKLETDDEIKYIAYAVLQSAQLDMSDLFDGTTKLSISVREKLTLDSFKKIWIDLLSAIKCIHNNGFVHLDIKFQNVGLIISDGTITPILIDFGFTSPIGSNVCQKLFFGTERYMLPDFNDFECSIQSDMYAYLIMILNALFITKKFKVIIDPKKIQPLYHELLTNIRDGKNKELDINTIVDSIFDLKEEIDNHKKYKSLEEVEEKLYSKINPWFDLHHEMSSVTIGGNRKVYKYQKSRKNKNKKLKKHNQSRKKFLK